MPTTHAERLPAEVDAAFCHVQEPAPERPAEGGEAVAPAVPAPPAVEAPEDPMPMMNNAKSGSTALDARL